MKCCLICLLVLLGATLPLLVNPQDSRVHSEYIKDIKKTKVTTDLMYVVNAPAQFMQVQLSSLYQGEKLAKPPSTITLLIWSYSELGDATFEFTDDQMNTVREFAKRITL